MKVNLIKALDITLLNQTLEDYNYKTSKFPKYIIMNRETLESLRTIPNKYVLDTHYNYNDDGYWVYDQYPIAICNELEYGEVEIV